MKLLAIFLVLMSATLAGGAQALDPSRRLGQLHHTRWTIEDGAPPDIWALAQASDGYLWLGTGAGLFRFDGVRFEKLALFGGDRVTSSNITALLAVANGDMWIGYVSGDISRFSHGRLSTFGLGMPNASVYQIARDRTGAIWAALKSPQYGGVVRYDGKRWQHFGPEHGLPAGAATSILASRDGAIWVNLDGTLYVRREGADTFLSTGRRLRKISCITQSSLGDIWVSSAADGRPGLVEGPSATLAGRSAEVAPPPAPEPEIGRMIIDHDGAAWGTYQVGGVFRLTSIASAKRSRAATAERFSLADGLSSDIARPVLEDREGNIWVGSNLGLDRFRATNIVAASGVPATSRQGYLAAPGRGGAMFVATGNQLYRVDQDQAAVPIAALPMTPTYLKIDQQAGLWIGLERGLVRMSKARLRPVLLPAAAAGLASGWMQGEDGKICIGVLHAGIFCREGTHWRPSNFRLDAAHSAPWQMLHDRSGRVWLSFEDALAVIEHGTLRRFTTQDGLAIGKIGIIADSPSGVLVGGDFGLAHFDGHRFVTLDAERHPALSRIAGIVTTASGETWLNGIKGVVRLSSDELARAFTRPGDNLRFTLFDMKDGLPGVAQQDSDTPTAIESSDGRLWFVTSHGVAWLDPRHLFRNPVPPPVSIRALMANGKEYAYPQSVTLPAGSSNVEIDYTALSLSIPDRVRFRYKLSGVDENWIDPGTRRQAFYTKLGPGNYHFQVIAANNDGVWNRSGAGLDVNVPPTFVESIWFRALLLCLGLFIAWLVYALRVRQITDRLHGRLEERLGERERIARELHDTLLQGFQGLVFRFQAVADRLQPGSQGREMVESALDQADAVLVEGRNRVLDLRGGPEDADLSENIATSARRILATSDASFRIFVEGKPHRLHQIVQEELARIAQEALSNAQRHSRADCIEISIAYGRTELKLHIRDNGVGMGSEAHAAGDKGNHFGMLGMRERAARIGGVFTVTSQVGAGTEITLFVPGRTAYANNSAAQRAAEI